MRQRRLKNEINVVPYIDVMLVLLVIFMVATPMMTTGSVNLASSGASTEKPEKFVRVEIEADGALSTYDLAGKHSKLKDVKALHDALLELAPKTPILIAGDMETQYKNIVAVLEEAKKMGFSPVALETKSK